jgi:hypothetical protein
MNRFPVHPLVDEDKRMSMTLSFYLGNYLIIADYLARVMAFKIIY